MPEVVIDGMRELQETLTRMSREFAAIQPVTMEKAMTRSLYLVIGTVADYPEQKPTTYIRQGTLGRKWTDAKSRTITKEGGSLVGKVGNNTEYGPWVQSHVFQTRLHRANGWKTDRQALEENSRKIAAEFDRAAQEIIDK